MSPTTEPQKVRTPPTTKAGPDGLAPEGTPPPTKAGSDGGAALPFDYPNGPTDAKPGQFVLAPTQSTVEEALEVGAERQAFIFYAGVLESATATTSVVKSVAGRKSQVPNALVVAIGPPAPAAVGDILLTAWASGTGLQRAIVVEGGTPESPSVRYLDMTLDSPSGWGEKVDQLPKGSFRKLSRPGTPGTTVACQDKKRTTRQIVISRAESKLLGLGFAGKLKVFDATACQALPIEPKVKANEAVRVPVLGAFTAATVTKTDAAIGRVWAKYAHGSEQREEAFGVLNVWPGAG